MLWKWWQEEQPVKISRKQSRCNVETKQQKPRNACNANLIVELVVEQEA